MVESRSRYNIDREAGGNIHAVGDHGPFCEMNLSVMTRQDGRVSILWIGSLRHSLVALLSP